MNIVREAIHEITEHPMELIISDMELESELGIDSIKKIMLMQNLLDKISGEKKNQLIEEYGVEKLITLQTVRELEEILEEKEPARCEVKEILAEITGFQKEEIREDMDLDMLGVDSIKKMQLLNRVLDSVKLEEVNITNYNIEQIMRMNSVGEFENLFHALHSENKICTQIELDNTNKMSAENDTLPMNFSQYLFFMSYWSTGTLSLSSRIRLKGEFDYNAAVAAWNTLIKGQPSLRTYFACDDNAKTLEDIVLKVEKENIDLPISVYDIQDISYLNQEKIIHDFCERILNSVFDIYTFPLCRLYAFHLSESETEIVLASCHLVSDGLGNQQILRDFVTLYGKYLNREEIVYGIGLQDYEDIIDKSLQWKPKNEMHSKKIGERYLFPLEKENLNLESFGRIGTQIFHISKGDMTMMYRIANEENISMYAIIVSSYLLALHEMNKESNQITINLPTGGRTGKEFEFNDIIGCFAQNMTITFEVDSESKKDPVSFAKKVKNIIDEKFVNEEDMNESFHFVQQMKKQQILENKQLKNIVAQMGVNSLASNLYLSFVGNTHIQKKHEMFEVVDYKAYTGMNKNSIDALVEIDDGKLMFSLNYDKDSFSDAFIRSLFDNLKYFFLRMRTIYTTKERKEKKNSNVSPVIFHDSIEVGKLQEDIARILGIEVDAETGLEEHYGISSIEKMKILTEVIAKYKVSSKIHLFQAKTVAEMAQYIESKEIEKKNTLAPAQKWLTNYFPAPYQWSGYSRFKFKTKLDSSVFEKALRQTTLDTEALRMKFKDYGSGIGYEIVDDAVYDIVYYSVEGKNAEKINEFVQSLLEEETKKLSIEELPLLKVRILVYAEDDFEFLVIGHHMVLDMISNDLLFGRLWNNYWAILANGTSYEKKFCLSKEDKSFGSYITETNTIFAKNKCKYLEYWKQEILGNATRLPFIQRETENIEKDVQVKKCICSEEDTKAWQREASRLKASFYSVIVLPMYQAISELTRQNKVLISHRMHGRMIEQNIYMDTVGNFAINYPVGLSVQNEYIESLIQNLDNKMKKVPMNGASYDLCGEELTEKFYPDEKVTDIRLNFLGNREDRKFYFLESSAEDDGQRFHMKKQRGISEIEVFFYIENRCLNIEIEYSGKRCRGQDIDKLLDLYLAFARKVIEEGKEIG